MASNLTHNFHIPLSSDLFQQIKNEAKKSKKNATEVVRQAIKFWLKQRKKYELHHAIVKFATKNAGTELDLNEDFENSSINILLDEEFS